MVQAPRSSESSPHAPLIIVASLQSTPPQLAACLPGYIHVLRSLLRDISFAPYSPRANSMSFLRPSITSCSILRSAATITAPLRSPTTYCKTRYVYASSHSRCYCCNSPLVHTNAATNAWSTEESRNSHLAFEESHHQSTKWPPLTATPTASSARLSRVRDFPIFPELMRDDP